MDSFIGTVGLSSKGLRLSFPVGVAATMLGVCIAVNKERDGARIRVWEKPDSRLHFHEKVYEKKDLGDYRDTFAARSSVLRNGSTRLSFSSVNVEFAKDEEGSYYAFVPNEAQKPVLVRASEIQRPKKIAEVRQAIQEPKMSAMPKVLSGLGIAQIRTLIEVLNNSAEQLGLNLRIENGKIRGSIEL